MTPLPIFLSLVTVVRNNVESVEDTMRLLTRKCETLAADYEIIVIDNASEDGSLQNLKELVTREEFPNIQVYALTKNIDVDTAISVGLENALGDFVVVINPLEDDIAFLDLMLDTALDGNDVVFVHNRRRPKQSLLYRFAHYIFNAAYKWFNGVDLEKDAPQFRVMSRAVVNFILQHPQPEIMYRHLPATGGFSRSKLDYDYASNAARKKRFKGSLDRGVKLIVSSGKAPMRAVTSLSFLGAIANLIYSIYVVVIWLFKTDVAPGWASLALQQSGMFFTISLVLLVFGEYLLHAASVSSDEPKYHIAQEFLSSKITRRAQLNIQELESNLNKSSNDRSTSGE
jgi:glycosyltransferase involved in cell wall biosynthesis